jgi:hypothetical protein
MDSNSIQNGIGTATHKQEGHDSTGISVYHPQNETVIQWSEINIMSRGTYLRRGAQALGFHRLQLQNSGGT